MYCFFEVPLFSPPEKKFNNIGEKAMKMKEKYHKELLFFKTSNILSKQGNMAVLVWLVRKKEWQGICV